MNKIENGEAPEDYTLTGRTRLKLVRTRRWFSQETSFVLQVEYNISDFFYDGFVERLQYTKWRNAEKSDFRLFGELKMPGVLPTGSDI